MKKTSKKLTRVLGIVVAFCMLVSVASAAVQPRYQSICTFTANIDISSSGRATCYGKVMTWDTTDVVDLTLELQRTTYNGTWTTIKTWTNSGSSVVSVDKDWYVASGYYYRVAVTAELSTSDGEFIEGVTEYSTVVQY